MENHRKAINSDEKPLEFEFGSLTPSSPSQDSFTEHSPADHLFLNGRLLPHVFPAPNNNTKWSISRTTSEYTSRSNSTNSRSSFGSSNSSSTSYSPRTSSFNGNNNSTLNHRSLDLKPPASRCGETVYTTRRKATEMVKASLYRSYSSQRWQYITPAPAKRSGRGIRVRGRKKKAARMRKNAEERRGSSVMKWWRRILMAAIFACRECHALEGA